MNSEIIIPELNSDTIESIIYEIRGLKIMLDFDLAKIYGYSTKAFNQQVKRNINKFPDRYMFKLTMDEVSLISRSQNVTTIMQRDGEKGGRVYLPYAFTEQGIYMLMTVLKGDIATKQSIVIIDTFKRMKDYIFKTNNLVNKNDLINLISKVDSHTKDITAIKEELKEVKKGKIDDSKPSHYLILNNERIESDIAYQEIYEMAKNSIYIIDDYIDIKTLLLLKCCNDINIIIFTDNKAKNSINKSFINDFKKDTGLNIIFKRNNNRFHDRYIIVDFNTNNELIYHCGASSKDSGNKITTITKINDSNIYYQLINDILNNDELII